MSLNELVVPRKIIGDGKIVNIQIHGFANAMDAIYIYDAQIRMGYTCQI